MAGVLSIHSISETIAQSSVVRDPARNNPRVQWRPIMAPSLIIEKLRTQIRESPPDSLDLPKFRPASA